MTTSYLSERLPGPPKLALVLGSGLGGFADSLRAPTFVPYSEVPGLPASAVAGHVGRFVFGTCQGVQVVAMQGRAHLYEGHSAQEVVLGLHQMLDAGAQAVIVTNAAGGIRPDLTPGTLMLISDHLNLTGQNCLIGTNDDSLGPRFPDMGDAYSAALRKLAHCNAGKLGLELAEGVYAGLLGPNYETPAEITMLRALGADAVGMSTVQEALAARHRGVPCLGISCITNAAAGLGDTRLDHSDVQTVAGLRKLDFSRLLESLIPAIAREVTP